jgi:4-hydroxythreonine-4-phosphate dehydrogenase
MVTRIVLTPGEPAGIGPDVTLQIAQQLWPAEIIVVADPELLTTRARQLNLTIKLTPVDFNSPATPNAVGELKILPVTLNTPCVPGQLDVKNAFYVMECLRIASDLCLQKKAAALVTGPVHKSIINAANIPFTGHTEFLAEHCNAKQVIMLFVVDDLKVALATTHLALKDVPGAITKNHLLTLIRLLDSELKSKFHLAQPGILVCGLNPHAGEKGLLGQEEIDIITPALDQLRAEQINVSGPLPADTIFTPQQLSQADAILAMYHDQALPVVKYLGFDRAVNVTLGLPIIRTSVDHGTALDLAGSGLTHPGSLKAAIGLAISLSNSL